MRAPLIAAAALLLISAGMVAAADAGFYTGTDVVTLTSSNFNSKVKKGAWLVEFYAPWCGHCKAMKEEWIKAATALKGVVRVGAVNADEFKDVAKKYGVQGFPTLAFMHADAAGNIKMAAEFPGSSRTAKEFVPWALKQVEAMTLDRIGLKPEAPAAAAPEAAKDEDFYAGTDVVTLTDANFEEKVTKSKDTWLVEFYAPWCGFCKKLKPIYTEAATAVKGKGFLAAVDCTKNADTCKKFGVSGYPTVKKFGADKKKPEDYEGDRSVEDIVGFVTGEKVEKKAEEKPKDEDFFTGTDVVVLSDADFEKKVVKDKGNWVVMFYAPWCGHCKNLKPTYIDAAADAKGKASFGAIDCTKSSKVCKKYEVPGYPTVKLFGKDKAKPEEYEGDRTKEDLVGFATGVKVEKPKEEGFFDDTDVVSLTDDDFEKKVVKSKDNWVVMFYAPWCGHCKNLKPTFIDAAADAKGKAGFGAIDCTKSSKVCKKYEVPGYPTVKLFGKDKDKPEEYEGDRTKEDLVGFATGKKVEKPKEESFFDDTDVVQLTDAEFEKQVVDSKDNWVVMFYAPWCGHCKNLKPTYIEAASEVKGKAHLAAMDCTKNSKTCKKYEVPGYPTVKLFGKDKTKPEEYEGDRTKEDLVAFATGTQAEKPKEEPFYADTDVVELNDKNFEEKVLKSKEAWLVEFYAPWCGFCKKLKETYIAVAAGAKGKALVGAVDCTKSSKTCSNPKLNITGYPTMKRFGEDKSEIVAYEGDRTEEDLIHFAETGKSIEKPKEEPFYVDTDVEELTADNFEEKVIKSKDTWVVKFYAPWCGYCKDLKPSFTDAAKGAKGKAHFGGVDCTEHHSVCQKYEVPGYPTLKKFGADKEKPEEFEGARTVEELVAFATGVKIEKPKEEPFYDDTDVVQLTADDFDEKVKKSKDTWLVEFYAPWCGFCKRIKPTWIDLATKVKGKAGIGAVDCTQNSKLCSKLGVDGYPTIKKFGADKESPEDYEGDRSVEDLAGFATGEKVEKPEKPKEEPFYDGTDVQQLTEANFEKLVGSSKDTWLVEFYAPWCGFCKRIKPTWIDLATAVKGKAGIGAIDCTQNSKLCKKFDVSGYPTIKKFGADKTKPEEYNGDRSLEDLTSFATGKKAEKKATEEPKKDEFYDGTDVMVLNDDNFEKLVLKSKEAWLVEFYAPWCGFCKRLKPTYTELAAALKGKANIAAIDCTVNSATCGKFDVSGYPTVKKFGADKTKPEEYEGDRSVEDLTKFITGAAPEKKAEDKAAAEEPKKDEFYDGTDVVTLTDANFEEKVTKSKDTWLVEFYAPWCGFCKKLKPTWIELATAVKGKASIGAVDCTQHKDVCSKFGVKGYPTLKKFGAEKEDPEPYSGGRTLEDLKKFAIGEEAKDEL